MSRACLTSSLYITSSNAAGPDEGPEAADTLRHDTQEEIREIFTEREGASGRQTDKRDAHNSDTKSAGNYCERVPKMMRIFKQGTDFRLNLMLVTCN